ncbi:MAG: GNAT family N-acetyltransferase [Lachnospiraceae bacterium]|nr:GNAT family N-acetyltransferase [Lachnospiraceae bacterium]
MKEEHRGHMETTLCYIEKDGAYLMLHRIKKKNDLNEGKWIGIGGKFEADESPEECMRREVREETGLTVKTYRYRGIVTFVSDRYETEYMHLFHITETEGELKDCEEGVLEWVSVEKLHELPHWLGDRAFLSLLRTQIPFFSMKVRYVDGDHLESCLLNEQPVLFTDRLILRPFIEEDAKAVYENAKDPEIGPLCGWIPHPDIEHTKEVLRDILIGPDSFAIVRVDTGDPIGACSLFPVSGKKVRENETAEEIGYWLGRDYWGQGYATEIVKELQRYAFEEKQLDALWCCYYDGNERSHNVQTKCGFVHEYSEVVERRLLGDKMLNHSQRISRSKWEDM